jgi:DNA (cytosine-5)-methyltransferase 1
VRILNLYAGIGGNRKLWGDTHDITAVELNPQIAKIYQDFFPKDKVIVTDAHQYLLDHFFEYDFIWSSPPCQTHSSFRHNICVRFHGTKVVYPDMVLWQEIIFLKYYSKNYVVENVKPYYEPLIKPDFILQRHYFWSNKIIPPKEFETDLIRKSQIPQLQKKTGFNLRGYKLKNKRQVLRNCVRPDLGKYIKEALND